MTDQPIELSDLDRADLEMLGTTDEPTIPEPEKHTLLEVWREILSNIESAEGERIGIAFTISTLSHWPQLTAADMPAYLSEYSALLKEARNILHVEIDLDPEALKRTEKDAEENHEHYLNLLLQWQQLSISWERAWDVLDPAAIIKAAAISDAHKFILGGQGLVAHLDNIRFVFTDEERAGLAAALQEWQEAL